MHFGQCIVLHYTCRNKKSRSVSVHELLFPLYKLQVMEEQGAGGEVEKQGGGAEVLEPRAAAADGCTVTVLQVRLNSSA